MQAAGEPDATAPLLAGQLMAVWRRLLAGGGSELYRTLDEADLTLTQLKTLEALLDRDEDPSVKQLAQELGLSLPGASRIVEALSRRGYVDRREDEHDRRMKRVGITDVGREVITTVNDARLANLERFARDLTDEQRARLSEALSHIVADEDIPR